jgi:hypothetical protein
VCTGERESRSPEPLAFVILYGRGRIRFGKRSARLLEFFITGRLPSKSGGAAYRRLHRRLLRPVFSNVMINNVTATTISANERYMRSTAVRLFIKFCEYIFSCYLFPFILLFSTSSMFELHVVVAGIVMFNILELIMEVVPNYSTFCWSVTFFSCFHPNTLSNPTDHQSPKNIRCFSFARYNSMDVDSYSCGKLNRFFKQGLRQKMREEEEICSDLLKLSTSSLIDFFPIKSALLLDSH